MVDSLVDLRPRLVGSLLPRPIPLMRDWAESTIVIPDGPYKGHPFHCETQPFAGLFFDAVDSGRWDRIAATGPTQTGKSLICYVVPVLYHVFALRETVVAGLPNLDIAQDKWAEDFLPVIEASPELAALLPRNGEGSRGGRVKARVRFRNGSTLRFMTGGGKDKSRAGFTSRVLAVTEVDGLDEQGTTSREADKLKQMEGRLRAFLKVGIQEYLECTVSTDEGRIWQEYIGGTQSRIVRPCPHCGDWVTPEREHLVGWQDAEDVLVAREGAAWSCPSCAAPWTEDQRYDANLRGILVHRGQEVTPEGAVVGPAPRTRTLGFRWTAVDNHFATAADVAEDEWSALHEVDRENAEKELHQFVHCIPWQAPDLDLTPLDPEQVRKRTAAFRKGIVPEHTIGIGVGVDTGKRRLHWVAMAVTPARRHVIEYGEQPVEADKLGLKPGLIAALHALRAYYSGGWASPGGRRWVPSQVWIDARWHEHTDPVYGFCTEASKDLRPGSEVYRASLGYGEAQRGMPRYRAPDKLDQKIRYLGRGYHLARSQRARQLVVHCNSDHWKSELHQGLAMDADEAGAIVLYETASPREHQEFVEHLTAEQQQQEFIEGRGERIVWKRLRRQNHFLDAGYGATAACDLIRELHAKQGQQQTKGWFAAQQQRKGRR